MLLIRFCRLPARSPVSALFGSPAVSLGVIALSGYFTGIVQSHTWGRFTRMAVHTASGFLVLGTGLAATAGADDRSRSGTPSRWLPLLVGIGAAAITLCLWQALVVEENAQLDLIRYLAARNPQGRVGSFSRVQPLLPRRPLGTVLGHGLKLMLQTTDRLWLLTGPTGTTVVL